MKLGISSYAYGWGIQSSPDRQDSPMNVLQLIERAAEIGAEVVQIADNIPLEELDPTLRREAAALAKTLEIEIEVGARKLTFERVERLSEIAREFDAAILRFVIDGGDYRPHLGEVGDLLRRAESTLEGTRLAIENHDRFRACELRGLMEQVDSDRVGICLDTANSIGAGEGIEAVTHELAPWVFNLHVKDIRIGRIETLMGFYVEGRPAGEGQINIPWVLNQMTERCVSVLLETWTPRQETLCQTIRQEAEWVLQSYRYLDDVFRDRRSYA